MKIKICGIFRDEDIDYINEARPDYSGFVFVQSRRQVSPGQAARLRQRLEKGIETVGVFVNAPVEDIIPLYRDGVISLAQLHGTEDEFYISRLKAESGSTPIPVIKAIKVLTLNSALQSASSFASQLNYFSIVADYLLIDSQAGSGKTFDWNLVNSFKIEKPWFLAGGIRMDNIKQAMALNPFAIDVSSGVETNGIKDREKILQLTAVVRKGNTYE